MYGINPFLGQFFNASIRKQIDSSEGISNGKYTIRVSAFHPKLHRTMLIFLYAPEIKVSPLTRLAVKGQRLAVHNRDHVKRLAIFIILEPVYPKSHTGQQLRKLFLKCCTYTFIAHL